MLRKQAVDGADHADLQGIANLAPYSRVLNQIFETVLFVLAGAMIFAAVGPMAGWWHYEVIESGSMTPALRVGGVAIVQAEPSRAVSLGQIVAFHPPGIHDYVRIHRVITIIHRGGQTWIRTKGDANNAADPGPVRLVGKTVYVERAFVPYVGYAGVWLYKHSTRTGLESVFFVLMVSGGLWLIWANKDEEAASGQVLPSPAQAGRRLSRWGRPALRRPANQVGASAAHIVAERAATASLATLNDMYTEDQAEADSMSATPYPALPEHKKRATVGR
jgi:signal peptidase I